MVIKQCVICNSLYIGNLNVGDIFHWESLREKWIRVSIQNLTISNKISKRKCMWAGYVASQRPRPRTGGFAIEWDLTNHPKFVNYC